MSPHRRTTMPRLLTASLLAVAVLGSTSLSSLQQVHAVDTAVSKDAPDLSAVRDKLKAADWSSATRDLNGMVDRGVLHPDVYNLLGYSLRKAGDPKQAQIFYKKALEFDPNHKGALEYLGELYVDIGDLPKAREHVAILQRLCPAGCEELADLEEHVSAASAKTAR